MRLLLPALLLLSCLAYATPARGADLSLDVAPREGAVLGAEHRFTGALTQGGRPAPGQVVLLRVRAHPFAGEFSELARTITAADGRYRFVEPLERNHQVQIHSLASQSVPATSSRVALAYVFPVARLSARTIRRNVVRITQTLTVPRDVVLEAPTRFYLGRARARTAAFVGGAPPRRIRPGRFVARITVRVPAAYEGRFSYAACFRATLKSGLGDPKARCPARRYAF